MACAIVRTDLPAWPASEPIPALEIGRAFLTDHLVAFEVLSVLLLAAMIGAIVLGRQRDFGDEHAPSYGKPGPTRGKDGTP